MQQTVDKGSIIAGSIDSPVTGKDAILIKTDPSGNEQRILPLGRPGENISTSVIESNDWGYVIAGITNSLGTGAEDAWLVKVGRHSCIWRGSWKHDPQEMINDVRLQH